MEPGRQGVALVDDEQSLRSGNHVHFQFARALADDEVRAVGLPVKFKARIADNFVRVDVHFGNPHADWTGCARGRTPM